MKRDQLIFTLKQVSEILKAGNAELAQSNLLNTISWLELSQDTLSEGLELAAKWHETEAEYHLQENRQLPTDNLIRQVHMQAYMRHRGHAREMRKLKSNKDGSFAK